MTTQEVGRLIAVVPVCSMDTDLSEALCYAARLAPQVLAVHIRQTSDTRAIEAEWSQCGTSLPLVIVDASGDDCAAAFHRALDVLNRLESPGRIVVVLPSPRASADGARDWRDAVQSDSVIVVHRLSAGGQ